MKRFGWILVFLAAAFPAFAATKITVEQLKSKLDSLHQSGKEDQEVADALKGIDLSEQLTRSAKIGMMQYVSGPLSAAQINILEGRSAFLAPPPADVPAAPAPDAGAQKGILAKAAEYVTKIYIQNPRLLVSKTISRYQDDVQNTSNLVGLRVDSPNLPAMLVDTRVESVDSDKGLEKPAPLKNKIKWGQNGLISEGEPGPALILVIQEAESGEKLEWLRWEMIDHKQVAVFSFAVNKKKSHFDVNYCCFPDTDTEAGIGTQAGAVQPVVGSVQSVTSWKLYKKVVGYHGQIFVDPDSGAIVRIITIAELKPTDFVHQEMMRVDYGPIVVDGKQYILPQDSFTITEVVPNGDAGTAVYSVRHILFSVTYDNYQPRY